MVLLGQKRDCNLMQLTTKSAVRSCGQWADALRRCILPWICQHVLSLLQGFARHLAILERGCVCLYPHPSLPLLSTDSSV